MKYLIDTLENLQSISSRIANERGCDGLYTIYWFGWTKHPTREEYTLLVPNEEVSLLTVGEQNLLKEQEELNLDGWFDYYSQS